MKVYAYWRLTTMRVLYASLGHQQKLYTAIVALGSECSFICSLAQFTMAKKLNILSKACDVSREISDQVLGLAHVIEP